MSFVSEIFDRLHNSIPVPDCFSRKLSRLGRVNAYKPGIQTLPHCVKDLLPWGNNFNIGLLREFPGIARMG
jgi:hypothetical protein